MSTTQNPKTKHLTLEPKSHYKKSDEAHSNMSTARGGDDIWILITAITNRLEKVPTDPLTEQEAYVLLNEMLAEVAAVHDEAEDSDVLHFLVSEIGEDWESALGVELDYSQVGNPE